MVRRSRGRGRGSRGGRGRGQTTRNSSESPRRAAEPGEGRGRGRRRQREEGEPAQDPPAQRSRVQLRGVRRRSSVGGYPGYARDPDRGRTLRRIVEEFNRRTGDVAFESGIMEQEQWQATAYVESGERERMERQRKIETQTEREKERKRNRQGDRQRHMEIRHIETEKDRRW